VPYPHLIIELIFNPNTNTASLVALVPTLSSQPETDDLEVYDPEAADPENVGPEYSDPEGADQEYVADPEYYDPEDDDLEVYDPEADDLEAADPENVGPPNIDPELADKLKELTQVIDNLLKEKHPEGISETHSIAEWCSLPNPDIMKEYIDRAAYLKLKVVLLLQFIAPCGKTIVNMHAQWMHYNRIIFNPDITWSIETQPYGDNHHYRIFPLYQPTLHDDHLDFDNDQKKLAARINELIKTMQVTQINSILQSEEASARILSVVDCTHPRLGAASPLSTLPTHLLQQILEKAEDLPCGFFAQRRVMPEMQLTIQIQSVASDDGKPTFLVAIGFSLTRELQNAPNCVINSVIAETQNLANAFRELVKIDLSEFHTEIIEDIRPHASNERIDQQLCLMIMTTTNTCIVDGLQKISGHSPISTDPNSRSNISFREELRKLIRECESATIKAECAILNKFLSHTPPP
jgi:hypothetical protein